MSSAFKVFVVLVVVAIVTIRTSVILPVRNPTNEEMLAHVSYFLGERGFQDAGTFSFTGRPAGLFMRGECHLTVITVALQSWQEPSIRNQMSPGQDLWYVHGSDVIQDGFLHTGPLIKYYIQKIMRYVGLGGGFQPAFAILSQGDCAMMEIDWPNMSAMPFISENTW